MPSTEPTIIDTDMWQILTSTIFNKAQRILVLAVVCMTCGMFAHAQTEITAPEAPADNADSIMDRTIDVIMSDTTAILNSRNEKAEEVPLQWRPNPQRALWLALVFPGGGQIYNRKYWKLPLVYGGMMGCLYAMNWNNMMYKDYSQAYLDIMDSDTTTQSYNKFLHLGKQIDSSNEERYKKIFKSRKDRYRRWRDMSFFCLLGVYALSVIDAYVDAELSEFDISKDLSLRVEPAVIGTGGTNHYSSFAGGSQAVGLQCSLNF